MWVMDESLLIGENLGQGQERIFTPRVGLLFSTTDGIVTNILQKFVSIFAISWCLHFNMNKLESLFSFNKLCNCQIQYLFLLFPKNTNQDCPVPLDSVTVYWASMFFQPFKHASSIEKVSGIEAEGSTGNHWIFQFVFTLNELQKMTGYFSRTMIGFFKSKVTKGSSFLWRMLLLHWMLVVLAGVGALIAV